MHSTTSTSETWRATVGFPNYEVSDCGRVRRAGDPARGVRVGRVMALQKHKKGYRTVALWHSGVQTRRTVHVLVWEAFVGPRPQGAEVNHLNGVKHDNMLGNLELTDSAGNKKHAAENGLAAFGLRNGSTKLRTDQVLAIIDDVAAGHTQRAVAAKYGISQGHVSDIVNGKRRRTVRRAA